jgi:hypothetical protein
MKTLAKIIITILIFGVVIVGANLARDCDYFGGIQGCTGVVKKKPAREGEAE